MVAPLSPALEQRAPGLCEQNPRLKVWLWDHSGLPSCREQRAPRCPWCCSDPPRLLQPPRFAALRLPGRVSRLPDARPRLLHAAARDDLLRDVAVPINQDHRAQRAHRGPGPCSPPGAGEGRGKRLGTKPVPSSFPQVPSILSDSGSGPRGSTTGPARAGLI